MKSLFLVTAAVICASDRCEPQSSALLVNVFTSVLHK